MATGIGKEVVKIPDAQVRLTGAGTFNGTAATKGTATDLLLTIITGVDGTSSFSGGVSYVVQGSNDGSTYTAVTPDKGTLSSDSAANTHTAHFAQLQYKQYRTQYLNVSGLANCSAVYNYQPVADSADATVA